MFCRCSEVWTSFSFCKGFYGLSVKIQVIHCEAENYNCVFGIRVYLFASSEKKNLASHFLQHGIDNNVANQRTVFLIEY